RLPRPERGQAPVVRRVLDPPQQVRPAGARSTRTPRRTGPRGVWGRGGPGTGADAGHRPGLRGTPWGSGPLGPLPEGRRVGEVGHVPVERAVGVLVEAPRRLDAGLARRDVVGDPQAVARLGGGVDVEPEVPVAVQDDPVVLRALLHLVQE